MSLFHSGKKKEASGCSCGSCGAESSSQTPSTGDGQARVKILGSGCKKCNQLEDAAREALEQLGMDTSIDHVTDFSQIAAYGVMTTPALVADGKVLSYGKVLSTKEVVKLLESLG